MKKYKRSSDILMQIVENHSKDELFFGEILAGLGQRTFGLVLIFFSLPSALPFSFIPGISLVFSLPILLVSVQMILARKSLWIPSVIRNHKISTNKAKEIIHKTIPYLVKVERFLKPRLAFMNYRGMEIITGIVIMMLALLLLLPIPFSNFIFAALIIIFSLGLIEKDGFFILCGYFATILYFSVLYLFMYAAITAFLGI